MIENKKDIQKQKEEVSNWWNSEKTKKWHNFYYTTDYKDYSHLLLRQKKSIDYLKKLYPDPKNIKVLELGYGGGQTAKKMLDIGYNVTGIDISEHFNQETSLKNSDYIKKGQAKFLTRSIDDNFPFEDDSFDVVIVLGALQYVGDLDNCMKNISRTLKKNGHFILTQSNMYSLHSLFSLRGFLLKIVYLVTDEKYMLQKSFRSILIDSKLKKYFSKYKHSKLLNNFFFTKGDENWKFKIKKRLFNFKRLEKILKNYNFLVINKDCATFLFARKGFFYYVKLLTDKFLQFLSSVFIFNFLRNLSDNIILISKNNKS
ncbi:class I SAM-dependent methyltransferase [Candidatus Pelagibacter sp. HIMB1587]|uniref:class I SAM-dependent methyltransferase n=1 Tax=Candidatus Pelagibacter sp. HIMB1587 TaxID=3413354 RepID=UPI003F83FF62